MTGRASTAVMVGTVAIPTAAQVAPSWHSPAASSPLATVAASSRYGPDHDLASGLVQSTARALPPEPW